MRVLLVNHFPLEGSGSGTYTRNLALHLHKRGHDVQILFPENRVPEAMAGIPLRPVYFTGAHGAPSGDALPFNFPCFTTHPRSLTTFADLGEEALSRYLAAFDGAIARQIRHFRPHVVHGQHLWCLSHLAARHGIPCVVTAHGTDLMGHEKWPDLRQHAHLAAESCKRIICISRENRRLTEETLPEAGEKAVLLPNGYNEDIFYREPVPRAALLAEYGVSPAQRVVCFAGKLTAFKGVDTLLRAAQRYEARRPGEIVTLLAGNGEEEGALKRLAGELKLQNLRFLGHKSQDALRRLYHCADVFAIPSRNEPFGLVALEAMACGLPVVASNTGGLPDFITPAVGALVPQDDDGALCDAILNELQIADESPARKEAISAYAAEGFSQAGYVRRLEKIYQAAIQ